MPQAQPTPCLPCHAAQGGLKPAALWPLRPAARDERHETRGRERRGARTRPDGRSGVRTLERRSKNRTRAPTTMRWVARTLGTYRRAYRAGAGRGRGGGRARLALCIFGFFGFSIVCTIPFCVTSSRPLASAAPRALTREPAPELWSTVNALSRQSRWTAIHGRYRDPARYTLGRI